ncbi:MAG: primosomal protein N' [Anaerolineales bacterium]
MPRFVQIAVNVPRVSGVFHYHCPPELEERLRPGHLVLVPFGPRTVQGVVLGDVAQAEVPETKPVSLLLDPEPVLTALQLQLAAHLSETCLAPLAACVSLMLPAGIGKLADVEYSLTPAAATFDGKLKPTQARLLKLLNERGALRGGQLNRALPRRNWRVSARSLMHLGLVTSKALPPLPAAKPKTVRTVAFVAAPSEENKLGRQAATRARRARMLGALQRQPGPMDAEWLYAESRGKLQDLYALAELGLVRLSERESVRDPLAELPYDPSQPPQLTADQARAWQTVEEALTSAQKGEVQAPMLLHGVTGSGKTEIYLRAVADTLARGRQAIVLVPEIALTPQAVQRFLGRFPGQVGLLHSELSEGERYDTWRRARSGDLKVIIGPRSALFAPLADLGLIVVDEEHDDSYYEAGQDPHYHAREAAVAYARLAGAVCLLGSATPDVGSYSQATRGDWQLIHLPDRILAHREAARAHRQRLGRAGLYKEVGEDARALELPPVEVIDMRRELKSGNRSIFSSSLQAGIKQVLAEGQQAILFLNRRGSATYVFCRACGYVLRCPNCDNPLTQHLDERSGRLVCHHCGYTRQMPPRCPNCASPQLRHYGTGTETVEAEVHKLFPKARTLRWDRSSTRTKGAHQRILRTFSQGQADILIGTQMLAKGLDLPLVTLVGVVLAEVGLNLPDYRAAERVFQVLTQVAGRAGRSPLGGRVVLQTFQPEHYAIQAAAGHNYASFFEQESSQRRALRWPPFAQLLRLEYRHPDAAKAEQDAFQMGETIGRLLERGERRGTEMVGPVPCFYPRLRREYRWQILLRGPEPTSLIRGVKLSGWRIEVDPPSVL